MPSMLSTAIQNTFIKAGANLTAQLAAQWHAGSLQPLDLQRILEFAVFGFVGATVGYLWHGFLEETFPTRIVADAAPPTLPQVTPGDKDDAGKKQHAPAAATSSGAAAGGGPGPGKIRWRNIAAKLVADQTLGLSLMITIFLVITNVARQPSLAGVFAVIREKLFGLVRAGWHIWPAVALCNFLWVPVRWRVLVSSFVGFGWNIFLSVVSMGGKPG